MTRAKFFITEPTALAAGAESVTSGEPAASAVGSLVFALLVVVSTTTLLADEITVVAPTKASLDIAAAYSESHRGQSLIVMFDGAIIFEQYANGGSAQRLQMLASGSKSFVGIAAAAVVEDGILKLDDPVFKSIPEWKDDPAKRLITYRQLLTLTSGLKASGGAFGAKQPGWKKQAEDAMTGMPGEQFSYGANQLNVFAYALERSLGNETFEQYLKRRIADPLGISIQWRVRCEDGHPQVGGGGFITSRDWAKFGEFIRLHGKRGDRQVVEAKLIAECFQGTEPNPAYGQTWWLKKQVTSQHIAASRILASEWSDVANADSLPDDLIAACGAGKQRLYVIPSKILVVVRQASLPNRDFSDVAFLNLLLRNQDLIK